MLSISLVFTLFLKETELNMERINHFQYKFPVILASEKCGDIVTYYRSRCKYSRVNGYAGNVFCLFDPAFAIISVESRPWFKESAAIRIDSKPDDI